MTIRRSLLALATLLLLVGPAAAETTEEILTKVYDARGGLDNIKSVETARISGNLIIPGMMEAPFTMEWKRPGMLRMEFSTPQGDGVQAFDGETAWAQMPGLGTMELTGEQADGIRRQSDFDGPLVDWKAKGHSVEYLGQGEREGVAVHKLQLSQADGTELTMFIDAGTFLVMHQSGSAKVQGMETDIETYISDYKQVGELMLAHNSKTELIDVGMTQIVTMDSIEFNVDIADDRFKMPAVEEAAEVAAPEAEPEAEEAPSDE